MSEVRTFREAAPLLDIEAALGICDISLSPATIQQVTLGLILGTDRRFHASNKPLSLTLRSLLSAQAARTAAVFFDEFGRQCAKVIWSRLDAQASQVLVCHGPSMIEARHLGNIGQPWVLDFSVEHGLIGATLRRLASHEWAELDSLQYGRIRRSSLVLKRAESRHQRRLASMAESPLGAKTPCFLNTAEGAGLKHALASTLTEARDVGAIMMLLDQCPRCGPQPIAHSLSRIMPAIRLSMYKVFRDEVGNPAAFASWSKVSVESAGRIQRNERVTIDDWNCERVITIVDHFSVPGARYLIDDLLMGEELASAQIRFIWSRHENANEPASLPEQSLEPSAGPT